MKGDSGELLDDLPVCCHIHLNLPLSAHSEEPQCPNFPLAVLPQDAWQVILPIAEP